MLRARGVCSTAVTLRRFGVQRVRPWLANALRDAGFREPRPVQAAAMTRIAHHENTVIHAETGSGKTLAFLVPILSRLEPRVPLQTLVLLPSRELALQVASEIQQLAAPAATSGLHLSLVVGGVGPAEGQRAQREAQRELAAAVAARRAQILVATPSALRQVIDMGPLRSARQSRWLLDERPAARGRLDAAAEAHDDDLDDEDDNDEAGWTEARARYRGAGARGGLAGLPLGGGGDSGDGGGGGEGDGRLLLRTLGANLDSVVLDEVDALLPKPALGGADFYRQRDWKGAGQEARRRARHGPTAGLLRQLLRAVEVVRAAPPAPPSWGRRAAAPPSPSPRRVHLVAASATVSRGVLVQLRDLFGLGWEERALGVVGADGLVQRESGRGAKWRANARGERGVAGVAVPAAILHRVLPVADDGAKPRAVAAALRALAPRAALVVLPDEAPLLRWVELLRAAGLSRAAPLHEALGFPVRGDAPLSAARRAEELLDTASRLRRRPAEAAAQQQQQEEEEGEEEQQRQRGAAPPMAVHVTTERSVRGLDLPSLEAVVLLYCPAASDTYLHLAGRTGRGGEAGLALSVLRQDERRRLGLYSSQLKVAIPELRPEARGEVG